MPTIPVNGVGLGDQSKYGLATKVENVSATVAPDGFNAGKVSFQNAVYYAGQTGATVWFAFDQPYAGQNTLNVPFVFGGDSLTTGGGAGDQARFGGATLTKSAKDFMPPGWDSAVVPKVRVYPYVENAGGAVDFLFTQAYETPAQLNTPFYFGGTPVVTGVTLGDQTKFGLIPSIVKPPEINPSGISPGLVDVGKPRVGDQPAVDFLFTSAYDKPTTFNVPFYFGPGLAVSATAGAQGAVGLAKVENAAKTVAPDGFTSEKVGRVAAYFQGQNGVNVDFKFVQDYTGQTPLNTPFYFSGLLNLNVGSIDAPEPGIAIVRNQYEYVYPTAIPPSGAFGVAVTGKTIEAVGFDSSFVSTVADVSPVAPLGDIVTDGLPPGGFGTAKLDRRVKPLGIASDEYGKPNISPQFVRPAGLVGAIGAVRFDQTLTTRTLYLTGFSSYAFGALKVDPRFIYTPGFRATSDQARFGNVRVQLATLYPLAIPPGDFGTARVDDGKQFVTATGIAPPHEELPQPQVIGRWEYIYPTSVAESGIFGDTGVRLQFRAVSPPGFDASAFTNFAPLVENRNRTIRAAGHSSSVVADTLEQFNDYFLNRYTWTGSAPSAAVQLTGLSFKTRGIGYSYSDPTSGPLYVGPFYRQILHAITNGSVRAVLEWESSESDPDVASGNPPTISATTKVEHRVVLSDLAGNVLSTASWVGSDVLAVLSFDYNRSGWLAPYSDGFIVRTEAVVRRYSFTTSSWSTLVAADAKRVAASGNLLVVGTSSGTDVYNPVTGALLWSNASVPQIVATDGTDVFALSGYTLTRYRGSDGVQLAATDTTPLWDYSLYPSQTFYAPRGLVVAAGTVFVRRFAQIEMLDYSLTRVRRYTLGYLNSTSSPESDLSLTDGYVLAGGAHVSYTEYDLNTGEPTATATLRTPETYGVAFDPVTLKEVWRGEAYRARTFVWLRDRQVRLSTGAGPEAFGPETDAGFFLRYVYPQALDSATFGTTTVANVARLIDLTNRGIAGEFGTTAVAPGVREIRPVGSYFGALGSNHLVEFGTRYLRNAGGIFAFLPSNGAVVESTIRYIDHGTHGKDMSSFGAPTTWFRVRDVAPPPIAYAFTWAQFGGEVRVEYSIKYINGLGWESSRFGTTDVRRNEFVVQPPSIVGGVGQPDVQWKRRFIKPQTVETFTEYGTAWVDYNPRYVYQYFDENALALVGGFGVPWDVANRNKTIAPYGWRSSRFSSGNFVYNNARVLEAKGADTALYGTTFVADRVRTVTTIGHESSRVDRWSAVYNYNQRIEPSGIPRLYVGVPYVWSNTQWVDFVNAPNDFTLWGTQFVAYAIRTVSLDLQPGALLSNGIPPPIGSVPFTHYVGLFRQHVDPTGLPPGRIGDQVFEEKFNIIKPWGKDMALYGEGLVKNLTPEIKPLAWQEFDMVWAHYVGLYTRTVDLANQSAPPPHEFLPRPVVEFRTKIVAVPGINSLRIPLLHDVRFDVPEIPVLQRVIVAEYPNQLSTYDPAAYGNAFVRRMPSPEGWVSSRFGQHWVRVQGCVTLWDWPSSTFGTPSLNPPLTISNVKVGINDESLTSYGRPRLSPFNVFCTTSVPGIDLNKYLANIPSNFPWRDIDDILNVRDPDVQWGRAFVSNKASRVVAHFHRSGTTSDPDFTIGEKFGTLETSNWIRQIFPDGVPPKRVGIPDLPTIGELFIASTKVDAYGTPTVTFGPFPPSNRTIYPAGTSMTVFGPTSVELFNRTIYPVGSRMDVYGDNYPMVHFPRKVQNVGGLDATGWGDNWVSFKDRVINPSGHDSFIMDYDPLRFNDRLKIYKLNHPVVVGGENFAKFGVAAAKLKDQFVRPYQIAAPKCLGHEVAVEEV